MSYSLRALEVDALEGPWKAINLEGGHFVQELSCSLSCNVPFPECTGTKMLFMDKINLAELLKF